MTFFIYIKKMECQGRDKCRAGGEVSRAGGEVSRAGGEVSRACGAVSRAGGAVSRAGGAVSRAGGAVSGDGGAVLYYRKNNTLIYSTVHQSNICIPRLIQLGEKIIISRN